MAEIRSTDETKVAPCPVKGNWSNVVDLKNGDWLSLCVQDSVPVQLCRGCRTFVEWSGVDKMGTRS